MVPCIRVIAFLTVLRNDSMNPGGWAILFDCCYPLHINANKLWLCMILLVIIWSKLLVI
jgi:hypothetical protein